MNNPSPLKYVGTQSQESVNMEAAMAEEAARAPERAAGSAMGQPSNNVDDVDEVGGLAAAVGAKIGDAAGWAAGKATDALQSAAGQVRASATTALTTYTKEDPIRALLIAAGTGALLMALLAMMTRSGIQTAKRSVQR